MVIVAASPESAGVFDVEVPAGRFVSRASGTARGAYDGDPQRFRLLGTVAGPSGTTMRGRRRRDGWVFAAETITTAGSPLPPPPFVVPQPTFVVPPPALGLPPPALDVPPPVAADPARWAHFFHPDYAPKEG